MSVLSHNHGFCELTAMLVSGRRCHFAPVDVHLHSMPWCWWCECEAELRALHASVACCEQTVCGSSQGKSKIEGRRERVGARDWANKYTNDRRLSSNISCCWQICKM